MDSCNTDGLRSHVHLIQGFRDESELSWGPFLEAVA